MRKFIAGSAVAAMMACSAIAQAAPVAPVAIDDVRAGSAVSETEELRGSSTLLLLAGLAVLAVVAYLIIDDGNGDDLPVSV